MEYNKKGFKSELLSLADDKYREFSQKLGMGRLEILGIKIPVLKQLAKSLAKTNWKDFFNEQENFCAEVVTLKGMCIGYAKIEFNEFLLYLKKFFVMVESWVETDTTVPTFRIILKNKELVWQEIMLHLFCDIEYEARLAIIILLDYFLTDEWIDNVLEVLPKINQGKYYVDMALAWLLSVCFVKYREKTLSLFEKKSFSKFVQNKAIQKCRESFRISDDDKQLLLNFKIS
ncbi:MAG TPA: DNA alkylation repair protein [Clostridiales bacterium]|nr:DNA alkylation repair protein [Clostridiales bacterium]